MGSYFGHYGSQFVLPFSVTKALLSWHNSFVGKKRKKAWMEAPLPTSFQLCSYLLHCLSYNLYIVFPVTLTFKTVLGASRYNYDLELILSLVFLVIICIFVIVIF